MSDVFYDGAAELATLTNTFTVASTPTDPTTVTLVVSAPDGTSATYTYAGATITKTSAGIFTKDVSCTIPGEWVAVWTGTGTASDIATSRWTVYDADAVLYCSPEALEARLEISSAHRAEVEGAIRAVTPWITEYCEDFFGRITATRTFVPQDLYQLDIGSLVSLTTLKTDTSADGTFATTWQASDYELLPYNPNNGIETKPYTKIRAVGSQTFPYLTGYTQRRDLVQIVGVWGWPKMPGPVREAALLQSSRVFRRKHSSDGVFGGSVDFPALRVGTRLDPDVQQLLAPYRRFPVTVG